RAGARRAAPPPEPPRARARGARRILAIRRIARQAPRVRGTARRVRWLPALLPLVLGGALATAETPPWHRTETSDPCAAVAPLRQPFFGDLHVHTRFSADAYIFGTRVGPRDAYDFARGATIPVSDTNEEQTRSATIDRPLDFMAVTDHAELFGEVDVCSTPGSPAFDVMTCQLLRRAEHTAAEEATTTVQWLFPLGIPNPPRS